MSSPEDSELTRRAVELIAGEVPAALSSWRESRALPDDNDLKIDDAIDLLALWGHLQRFAPEVVPREVWDDLQEAIHADGPFMAKLVEKGLDPRGWREALDDLLEQQDDVLTDEDAQAVNSASLLLFRQLDEADLAVWSAVHILGEDDAKLLADLRDWELSECQLALEENSSVFHNARGYITGLLEAYRDRDALLEHDRALFATTLKFMYIADEVARIAFPGETEPEQFTKEQFAGLIETTRRRTGRPEIPMSFMKTPKQKGMARIAAAPGPTLGLLRLLGTFAGKMSRQKLLKILFRGEDRPWTVRLTIPAEDLSVESLVTLETLDGEGNVLEEAGEVVLCGETLPLVEGRLTLPFGRLCELWPTAADGGTIRLRRHGREEVGLLVEPGEE